MLERALKTVIFSPQWGRQMRFLTGPRQAGKTTLARRWLKENGDEALYYLWDLRPVRDRAKVSPFFFTQDVPPKRSKAWICFDEIHKMPRWKNLLKGIFDSTEEHYQFIITGSSKLDLSRRAGDSLSGRFFAFHLYPLLVEEVAGTPERARSVPATAKEWIARALNQREPAQAAIESLLRWGGFPEPFLRQSNAFHKRWSRDYTDTVIREDIAALTPIIEKEHLYDVYRLLPEMVGSHLSAHSLAGHLEISDPAVKNYLRRLQEFYLTVRIHPYAKNIKRGLLKAPKVYLMDWSQVPDPGSRFENFVAIQLLARMQLWEDSTGVVFDLRYVRNRLKQETDFLLLREGKPWLLMEAKISDGPVAAHHRDMQRALDAVPLVQLCLQNGVRMQDGKDIYRLSASALFG